MNKDWLDIAILEDYLDGKLDAKTMNRVEREALEDPFVAEALAGLSESPKRSLNALSLLQKQLQDRIVDQQTQKKTAVITWQRLSIAATAAVMFISVSVIFWMKENNRQKELASLPRKVDVNLAPKPEKELPATAVVEPAPKQEEAIASVAADRATVVIDRAIKASKQDVYASLQKEKALAPQDGTLNEVVITQTAPIAKKQYSTGAVSQVSTPVKSTFNGTVIDNEGQPLPGVAISLVGSNSITTTDAHGNFSLNSDSLVELGSLKAMSIGYRPVQIIASSKERSNFVLSPDQNSLNEVVVVGFGRAKEEQLVSKASAGRVAGLETKDKNIMIRGTGSLSSSFEPVGGWDKFRDYLKTKNRLRNETKTGKAVVLSFSLSANGKPEDIKVLISIAEKYDEEAVRLLKKGPKWSTSQVQDSQLFVTIDF